MTQNNQYYIIREFYKFKPNVKLIKEAIEKDEPIILSGILQKANTLNRNGRVYPYDILRREATKYMEAVEENRALGELDHPDSAVVSLRQSSHKVIDMWWQGEELYGKVEVLDPDCDDARRLRGLLKSNVMLGISSRGVGSVKTVKGEDIVQSDFELIAFDFVSSPSTPGAYLFKEGRNWGMIPITESQYKKIKWICENGVCRMSDMLDESNIIMPQKPEIIIPEKPKIITAENCMCEGYKKLSELSNSEFWKKI